MSRVDKGDLVICKKDFNKIGYKKGNQYIITDIIGEIFRISSDEPGFYWFDSTIKEDMFSFDRYFITQKELRRIKIEKLYKI